jgi:AmmeMemoRadiSam system protein B/AmmeMemoRadiSam system protein A
VAGSVAGGVRPAAVAGLFYPSDPAKLRDDIARFLDTKVDAAIATGPATGPEGACPKAVIAPHAGYRYSGPTAGHAYQALAPRRGQIERVVVMGPAHRVRVAGVGLSSARAWSTPLGEMEVDVDACRSLAELPGVAEADDAHAPEHSIEVHLPFVHEVLGPVTVVPLVVGRADIDDVARVLDAVWGDETTAIVVSSDLSHYLDDATARERDRRTATAILEGRADDIGPHDACGCLPIAGLLTAAVGHGLAPRLLDLTTSADTAGDPARVVGYGSFALLPPLPLEDSDRRWLLELAARAIEHELRTGDPYPLTDTEVPEPLRAPGAAFVTLERGGELLGCIGSLDRRRALWRDVARNARGAAFEDPRFPALEGDDVDGLTIEVSVLSPLEELPAGSLEELVAALRPGVDGLVLSAGDRRGTFLPDVWEKIPDPEDFVRELVRKARWDEPWHDDARAWRYTTETVVR